MKIAGVDGCHFGWVVASRIDENMPEIQLFENFQSVLEKYRDYDVIVVDMPIGLASSKENIERREADIEAKKILSETGRGGSVFFPPTKEVIDDLPIQKLVYNDDNYKEACRISKEKTGRKISRQAFGLLKKIKEITEIADKDDKVMKNVLEFHPEITWYLTCGMRNLSYKKTKEGFQQRHSCLCSSLKIDSKDLSCLIDTTRENRCNDVAKDDIIDALSGLIVAKRIFDKDSKIIPDTPIKPPCIYF